MRTKINNSIISFISCAMIAAACICPHPADANVFGQANSIKKKVTRTARELNRRSHQMKDEIAKRRGKSYDKTKTTNPVTGEWGTQTGCEDLQSATCIDGRDDFANCMHQTKNYYYRLVVAHFEAKLASGANLSDAQRKELEEDIASLKNAFETGVVVDPDPKDPQRWLGRLNRDDQVMINRWKSKYIQEVSDDCNARFGVMEHYK